MSSNKQHQGKYPLHDIVSPHDHDVLSGRGNFVNYHAGNEHFRALVRKHKVAYVACPKPQKGKFSRMIVDEVRNRNPPGRFLKQDPNTKLWHDIGEKKALDKTRQALREGAPEISKELTGDEEPEPHGMQNSVLKGPERVGMYGLNDGLGGYGAPDLSNELDDPLQQVPQHAALSGMMPQQQLPGRQVMSGAPGMHPGHPGQLYADQVQRMQQQQQQQLKQQQQHQQRLQQQSLSRQLNSGGQLAGQLGGQLGGLGGLGIGGGGIGGMGVNPYANISNNDYDELEPTPIIHGSNSRYSYDGGGGQLQQPNQSRPQSQLQGYQQAQSQSQPQSLMQRQPQPQQQRSQNHSNSLSSHFNKGSGSQSNKKRPDFPRENSEQSLQIDHAFEDTVEQGVLNSGTGGSDKYKQKMGGSSAHLSIMSLTMSELDEGEDNVGAAGDLSAMFDSSLQISDNKRNSNASTGSSLNNNSSVLDVRRQSKDDSKLLDMSVATIGDGQSILGGYASSALGGEVDDSNAHMSFSHVFDDNDHSDRNNL